MSAAVSCGGCGHLFAVGENVWAEDWNVCEAPDWKWRWQTRYLCDGCHVKAGAS